MATPTMGGDREADFLIDAKRLLGDDKVAEIVGFADEQGLTVDFESMAADRESFEACVLESAVVGEETACLDLLACEDADNLAKGTKSQCSREENALALFSYLMVIAVIHEASIEALSEARVEEINTRFPISPEERAACEATSGAFAVSCMGLSQERLARTTIALFLAAEDQ